MTKNLSSVLTEDVLKNSYIELGSLNAVSRKFNVDTGTIKRYMTKFGLEYKPQVRHNCDHDFFSRENEESFYVAGFLAADGCVKKTKNSSNNFRYEIQLSLAKKDETHVKLIKDLLKAENPINNFFIENSKNNPKWNDTWSSGFTITSEKMFKDLEKFNIVPKKSLIYTFPSWIIDHPLCHHFMRGYNDGDGSFYIGKLKGNRTVKQVHFSLRGTVEFLETYKYILENKCNIHKKSVRINSKIGMLEYGGNNIVGNIVDYLYKDANFYLQRKYDIAMLTKNNLHYTTNLL